MVCEKVGKMNKDNLFAKLEKYGWFSGYPDSLKDQVQKKVEKDDKIFSLAIIGGDTECIYEEGDYIKWYINEFSTASHGLFSPEDVIEKWEQIEEGEYIINLSFKHGTKEYSNRFEQFGDYMHPEALELVNQALEDSGSPLRIIQLEIGGQDAYFAMTTLDAYIKAYKSNLLPKRNIDPFDVSPIWSEPDGLTLRWHLKRMKTLDKQWYEKPIFRYYRFQVFVKQYLKGILRNPRHKLKGAHLTHTIFIATMLIMLILKKDLYKSLMTLTTLDTKNISIALSHLFIWLFSYKLCLRNDRLIGYLIISLSALYFVLFSLPIVGWGLVFFMYIRDKIRVRNFKKEMSDVLKETGSTSNR